MWLKICFPSLLKELHGSGALQSFRCQCTFLTVPLFRFTYTPAPGNVLIYKLIAIGAVVATDYLFYKWDQFRLHRQQQRQQEQQQQQQQQQGSTAMALVAITTMAIYNQPEADSPLGFDFERVGIQDEQHSLYRQLLADMKDMKQQLRQQQQFAQQEVTYNIEIQRLQVVKDAKADTYHEEIQQLKQRLNDKQRLIDEKDKLGQAEGRAQTDKRGKDLWWERSKRGDEVAKGAEDDWTNKGPIGYYSYSIS